MPYQLSPQNYALITGNSGTNPYWQASLLGPNAGLFGTGAYALGTSAAPGYVKDQYGRDTDPGWGTSNFEENRAVIAARQGLTPEQWKPPFPSGVTADASKMWQLNPESGQYTYWGRGGGEGIAGEIGPDRYKFVQLGRPSFNEAHWQKKFVDAALASGKVYNDPLYGVGLNYADYNTIMQPLSAEYRAGPGNTGGGFLGSGAWIPGLVLGGFGAAGLGALTGFGGAAAAGTASAGIGLDQLGGQFLDPLSGGATTFPYNPAASGVGGVTGTALPPGGLSSFLDPIEASTATGTAGSSAGAGALPGVPSPPPTFQSMTDFLNQAPGAAPVQTGPTTPGAGPMGSQPPIQQLSPGMTQGNFYPNTTTNRLLQPTPIGQGGGAMSSMTNLLDPAAQMAGLNTGTIGAGGAMDMGVGGSGFALPTPPTTGTWTPSWSDFGTGAFDVGGSTGFGGSTAIDPWADFQVPPLTPEQQEMIRTSRTTGDTVDPFGSAADMQALGVTAPPSTMLQKLVDAGIPWEVAQRIANAPVGSAASRIFSDLTKGTKTASTHDYLSTLGTLGATGLGLLGANAQTSAYKDIANQFIKIGEPYRALNLASYQPGFSMMNEPGYSDAVTNENKILARLASAGRLPGVAASGNPFENPGAISEIMKYVNANLSLPALTSYRSGLARAGETGLGVGASASLAQAGTAGGVYNALGSGLSSLTNPPSTINTDLLNQLLQLQIARMNTAGVNY